MALFDSIKASLTRIKAAAADIRDAANSKGADIRETDRFSTWAEKISLNVDAQRPKLQLSPAGVVESFCAVPILKVPTVNIDGTVMSSYLNVNGGYKGTLFMSCEELQIPDYFTRTHITFYDPAGSPGQFPALLIKKITCGSLLFSQTDIGSCAIEEYVFPNATDIFYDGDAGANSFFRKATASGKGKIIAPKLTSFTGYYGNSAGGVFDATGSNFESCASWKCTITNFYQFDEGFLGGRMTGTVEFPALTAAYIAAPVSGELTIYAPVLTDARQSFRKINATTGTLHLFIGPNLSQWTTYSANVTTLISGEHLDIHIPAGDSTTKTTLDAAGVTYTQDYII